MARGSLYSDGRHCHIASVVQTGPGIPQRPDGTPKKLTVIKLRAPWPCAHHAICERVIARGLELLCSVLHLAELQSDGQELLRLERGGECRPVAAHQERAARGMEKLHIAQDVHKGCINGTERW